jgi:hypothetical protein
MTKIQNERGIKYKREGVIESSKIAIKSLRAGR